jgi:hypothetical protein
VPESQRGRLSLEGERSDIDTIRRAIAVHRARCGLDTEELDDCALLALIALASIRAAEQGDATEAAMEAGADGSAARPDGSAARPDGSAARPEAPDALGAADGDVPSIERIAGIPRKEDEYEHTVGSDTDPHSRDADPTAGARPWRDQGERYRVVIEHCPDCGRSVSGGAEVSEEVVAQAQCDHERVNALDGPDQGRATRAIAPRLRRLVFVRAKWRCEVPGCTNHLWLEVHHFTYVANGGKHVWWNLGVLCGAHHRAIHAGGLSIVRLPSGAIQVTHRDCRTYTGPEPTTHARHRP